MKRPLNWIPVSLTGVVGVLRKKHKEKMGKRLEKHNGMLIKTRDSLGLGKENLV